MATTQHTPTMYATLKYQSQGVLQPLSQPQKSEISRFLYKINKLTADDCS